MKTQISRWTDDPAKRRSGIYQQQGRMITDADLNELMELLRRRVEEALADVVGNGAPRAGTPGVVDAGPAIRRTTLYVDGVRARLEGTTAGTAPFALNEQADFPSPPAWPSGDQVIYADVWEWPTTALQDGSLLDPGLHGADTATRTQTLAQVKWCEGTIDPLTDSRNPQKGDATLALEIREGSSAADPCDPCAAEIALDNRIGNYLFRLEVHDVQGPANMPTEITLKWSSENGAEQHAQEYVPADFKRGDWIYEFYNDATEKHLGVHLVPGFSPTRAVLKDGWPAAADLPDKTQYPYVRRWDGYAVLVKSGTAWSVKLVSATIQAKDKGRALELLAPGTTATHGHYAFDGADFVAHLSGLKLTLTVDGTKFVAGDYWLATVREDADTAARVQLAQDTPLGIVHHYVVLAKANGTTVQPLTDAEARRLSFPQLTNLTADRIGYDPAALAVRWNDIIDDAATAAPVNVQSAIDLLVEKLESSDIGYALPDCSGGRLHELLSWSGALTVKIALDKILCELDAGVIPYDAGAGGSTVQQMLDQLVADVNTKVNRAGDTMTGALLINGAGLHVGSTSDPGANNLHVDGDCVIGGNLTVQGATTTINTATVEVEDAIIRTNKYAPQPTPQPINGGLEVFRGGTAANAQVIWDETDDRWKVGTEGNLLPIATGEARDVVTGVVVFQALPLNQEMLSGAIDPGLGVGPVCVSLALDETPAASRATTGDTGYGRTVVYRAEIDRSTGHFRIFARRTGGATATARVRWWAQMPRAGETTTTVAIGITISPTAASVLTNASTTFNASVTGTTNTQINWSVQEGTSGGSVSPATGPTSTYTAPAVAGTYHVIARSNANPSVSATATVTVTEPKVKEFDKIPDKVVEKTLEKTFEKTKEKDIVEVAPIPAAPTLLAPDSGDALGRSFIRPHERPDLGLPPGA